MTSSDPLFTRLAEIDPARDIATDQARTDALLADLRATITTSGPEPPTRPKRPRRRHRLARSAPIVISGLVAVLIGVVAVTELRHRPHHPAPASSSTAVAGKQALVDILAVLRRPQTALDRKVFAQSGMANSGFSQLLGDGDVDPASARVATITPWGSRVLLALMNPPSQAQSRADARRFGARIARRFEANRQGRLILWADHGGGAGGTPASIQAGDDTMTDGWGASYAGGSTGVRAYVVVPDGVARVTFVLPQTDHGRSQGPEYAGPLRITVAVHGNIAALEARRSCCQGQIPMIWYAADGRIVKQIGDVSASQTTRPAAHPRPAPPTAASRAAEHDPATPNPVTVTPHTGGPTTTFRLSWQLLLTGADYQFDPVGPQAANCYGANAIPGGLGGGTTDVRGQLYGESLGPLLTQPWCPGTYRVSVSVLDFGPGHPALRPPPQPFGSATFTVRP